MAALAAPARRGLTMLRLEVHNSFGGALWADRTRQPATMIGTRADTQRVNECASPERWRDAGHRELSAWQWHIEDATGDKGRPLYDIGQATERVAAAVQAARALEFPFTLTARAENFLRGNPDLDDTIKRLQAFEKVGADVLFAPGLPDLASVRAVCTALTKPINFMVGIKGRSFTVAELEAAGVKRISLATSLYRAAMRGLITAAQEITANGTFGFLDRALTSSELNDFMQR